MGAIEQYIEERDEQVEKNKHDGKLLEAADYFTEQLVKTNYVKSFTWAGVPIIQYPTDVMVMQEIIWKVRPTVIIECGIAFGGATLFYASLLDALFPLFIAPGVIAIDIDIRPHTRDALSGRSRIDLLEGSSIFPAVVESVTESIKAKDIVLVVLDSCHTHAHVLKELELYAPLVSVGSYIIVMDTAIEFYGHLDRNQERPWSKGNNPHTAVMEFLKTDMGQNFVIDKEVEARALITSAPDGFLRRVK